MMKFVGLAVVAALGALIVRQLLPDIQRYQKIRSM
jgi:uncharacterized protein YhdP